MVKEMLDVLMDGIKDADMLIDYATKAKINNDDTYDWFKAHAKMRVDTLMDDYMRINNEIMLEQKSAEGDPVAEALRCYLKDKMKSLKADFAML